MKDVRLFLLAGGTGSGKSHMFKKLIAPDDVAIFDYDQLMHDAVLCAFPYAKGRDLRWTKRIWESTKTLIDADQAMLRTIMHQHKYIKHAAGNVRKFVFFGYQLVDEYWINTAKFIVSELTDGEPNAHLCWLNPGVDIVIERRRHRKNKHDQIDDEMMRQEYSEYVQNMGRKFNSRHNDSDAVVSEAKRFLGIASL